jgi:hypothetical protein
MKKGATICYNLYSVVSAPSLDDYHKATNWHKTTILLFFSYCHTKQDTRMKLSHTNTYPVGCTTKVYLGFRGQASINARGGERLLLSGRFIGPHSSHLFELEQLKLS